MTDHIISTDTLKQLQENIGETALIKTLSLFIQETKKRLARLATAVKNGDLYQIEFQAHTIKGSAITFGAVLLYEQAKTLELVCQNDQPEEATTMATQLNATAQITIDVIMHQFPQLDQLK